MVKRSRLKVKYPKEYPQTKKFQDKIEPNMSTKSTSILNHHLTVTSWQETLVVSLTSWEQKVVSFHHSLNSTEKYSKYETFSCNMQKYVSLMSKYTNSLATENKGHASPQNGLHFDEFNKQTCRDSLEIVLINSTKVKKKKKPKRPSTSILQIHFRQPIQA